MVPRGRCTSNAGIRLSDSGHMEGPVLPKGSGLIEPRDFALQDGGKARSGDDTSVTLESSSAELRLHDLDSSSSRLPQHLSNRLIVQEPYSNASKVKGEPVAKKKKQKQLVERKGILKPPASSTELQEVTCPMQRWFLAKNKKKISFSSVEVRQYFLTVGDNPACHFGVPLSLDWGYEAVPLISVAEFERSRRALRRNVEQLQLSKDARFDVLKSYGFAEDVLKKAEKEVAKVQRQRNMTVAMQPLYKIEKLAESAGRGVRKVLLLRSSK